MSKTSKRSAITMPSIEEDKAITAAAKADPDAQPLMPSQLKSMVPIRALPWATEVREHEAARIRSLQPGGCHLLQVHWRRLAVAYGWSASGVRRTQGPSSMKMGPNPSFEPTDHGKPWSAAQLKRDAAIEWKKRLLALMLPALSGSDSRLLSARGARALSYRLRSEARHFPHLHAGWVMP